MIFFDLRNLPVVVVDCVIKNCDDLTPLEISSTINCTSNWHFIISNKNIHLFSYRLFWKHLFNFEGDVALYNLKLLVALIYINLNADKTFTYEHGFVLSYQRRLIQQEIKRPHPKRDSCYVQVLRKIIEYFMISENAWLLLQFSIRFFLHRK